MKPIGLDVHRIVEEIGRTRCRTETTECGKRSKVGIAVIENAGGQWSGKDQDVLDPLLWAQFTNDSAEE
jgi:hypothetical protein